MNRAEIVAQLRCLTDKEFIEIFYEACAGRNIYAGDIGEAQLVLANAERHPEDDGTYSPWRLQLLTLNDGNWADDSPVCQFGEHCGFETAGCSKWSMCAICGGSVFGT
jgi:hypothetical protein